MKRGDSPKIIRPKIKRIAWGCKYTWNAPRPAKPFCTLCDGNKTLRNGKPCPACHD